jgi:hypothetical protein
VARAARDLVGKVEITTCSQLVKGRRHRHDLRQGFEPPRLIDHWLFLVPAIDPREKLSESLTSVWGKGSLAAHDIPWLRGTNVLAKRTAIESRRKRAEQSLGLRCGYPKGAARLLDDPVVAIEGTNRASVLTDQRRDLIEVSLLFIGQSCDEASLRVRVPSLDPGYVSEADERRGLGPVESRNHGHIVGQRPSLRQARECVPTCRWTHGSTYLLIEEPLECGESAIALDTISGSSGSSSGLRPGSFGITTRGSDGK